LGINLLLEAPKSRQKVPAEVMKGFCDEGCRQTLKAIAG
jgi:hypothetical protein